MAAQQCIGRFPGKAGLLRSLAEALSHDPAATPVLTACRLGRVAVAVPEALNAAVRRAADQFLGDELASKPLGFYRWSPDLEAVFRQDRFLQRPLDPTPTRSLPHSVASQMVGRPTTRSWLLPAG